jgi:carbonic anhydrase/acetyltransferase-like protein (isoleucine patch superfamily)
MILPYDNIWPKIPQGVFVAPNATVIGDVQIGAKSSIWFQAILRGDVEAIVVGKGSNLQDGVIVHTSTGRCPAVIGNDVTVGHAAILHGCTVEDEVLIGMGAKVLDEAVVPSHCIVAAGALVPERKQLESGFLYAGIPARKIKALTQQQIARIQWNAAHYVQHAAKYC